MPGIQNPEDYESILGLASSSAPTKLSPPAKKVHRALLDGEVRKSKVIPETVTSNVTKMMKVVSITRTPGGRIANVEMRVRDGSLYALEVDEATVNALVGVFQQ